MSYIIIKEVKNVHGKVLPVVLLDSHSEILEFEENEKADEMAGVLNQNTDSGHTYRVKKVGTLHHDD